MVFFAHEAYFADRAILFVCIVAILSNELWIYQHRLTRYAIR